MVKIKEYDVLVIGSGGGTKLSTPAAALGYKAAIIEKAAWGGTCLNKGCIPSKMLIYPATVSRTIQDADRLNLNATFQGSNFSKLISRISRTVDSESQGIPTWYKTRKNLDYYQGHARFVSNNVVEVNGKKLRAQKIFIATGASPRIPAIEGLADTPFMTSTEALRNKKLPKKLLVIGGGYIGCELGHAYGALGADVQLLVRGKKLLEREDSQISQAFTTAFAKHYKVHFETSVEKVSYNHKNKEFTVTIRKGSKQSTLKGDALLLAVGVVPNTHNLGLENTSIKTDTRGFIRVNRFMETTVKGVYALGDVIGKYMFRHSVNFEGEFLFNSLFVDQKRRAIKYPPMPHAVFSFPEIGSVGATEDELVAKGWQEGKEYIVAIHEYKQSAMGMARQSQEGFVKVLFSVKTRKLLGVHILGDEASTMIHQYILAMTLNATIDHLVSMIYIHPALPEIARNAIRTAAKRFEELS